MRFLVDRCAGRTLTDWLRRGGHDVVEARQLGSDPGNRTLPQLANGDGRAPVSTDADFGQLIHLHDQPHAGLIRLPDVPVPQRIAVMAELIERHRSALEDKAIVTIRTGKLRISQHPAD